MSRTLTPPRESSSTSRNTGSLKREATQTSSSARTLTPPIRESSSQSSTSRTLKREVTQIPLLTSSLTSAMQGSSSRNVGTLEREVTQTEPSSSEEELLYIQVGDSGKIHIPKKNAKKSTLISSLLEDYPNSGTEDDPIRISPSFHIDSETLNALQSLLSSDIYTISKNFYTKNKSDIITFGEPYPEVKDEEDTLRNLMKASAAKFLDYIGSDCEMGYLANVAKHYLLLGDWSNFNNLFFIITNFDNENASCKMWHPLSMSRLKSLVLNAISHYTDYRDPHEDKPTDPERQNRCDVFHNIVTNYFDENPGFSDRLSLVNVLDCSDLSTCPGEWTSEMLLLPYESETFAAKFTGLTDGVFINYDWSNVYVDGTTVSSILLTDKLPIVNEKKRVTLCTSSAIHREFVEYFRERFERRGVTIEFFNDAVVVNIGKSLQLTLAYDRSLSKYHQCHRTYYTHKECMYDGTQILMTYPCYHVYTNGIDTSDLEKYKVKDRIVSYLITDQSMKKDYDLVYVIHYLFTKQLIHESRDMKIRDVSTSSNDEYKIYVGVVEKIDDDSIRLNSSFKYAQSFRFGRIMKIYSGSFNEIQLKDIRVGDIVECMYSRYNDIATALINRSLYSL